MLDGTALAGGTRSRSHASVRARNATARGARALSPGTNKCAGLTARTACCRVVQATEGAPLDDVQKRKTTDSLNCDSAGHPTFALSGGRFRPSARTQGWGQHARWHGLGKADRFSKPRQRACPDCDRAGCQSALRLARTNAPAHSARPALPSGRAPKARRSNDAQNRRPQTASTPIARGTQRSR